MMARFNPRARVGRDTSRLFFMLRLLLFQSTRPRGARRQDNAQARDERNVSIHAPAWGATMPQGVGVGC